jgi:type I restriction enzyme S subunit
MSLDNELPLGWCLTNLGKICTTVKGKKPKDTGERSETRNIPYISIKTFESKKIDIYASAGNYSECEIDDILIVWDGTRAGLIGNGVKGYIGSTLAKIYSEKLNNKLLFYFLKSQFSYINSNTKGVGIPHVDPAILFNIDIGIPPINEQHRIVTEIEKQFSRLDEAVSALKRSQANIKRYKASVLKSAVEGKLTAAWREQHPALESAEQLLERILKERRAHWEAAELAKLQANGKPPKDNQWKLKYKEPVKPDISDLPELPVGWVWASSEQLCFFITKGTTPSASKMQNDKGDIRFLKIYNLTFTGKLNYNNKPVYVDKETHDTELARSKVQPNDILINIVGPPLGQVSIIPLEIKEANINQAIARFRPVNGVESKFMALCLMTNKIMSWAISKAKTTVGQHNLTLEICRGIPVPLPPLAEQTQIVAEVEKRLSVAEEVEQQINRNLKRAEHLRQAILKRAFSGKLVPQNPNDEPAII